MILLAWNSMPPLFPQFAPLTLNDKLSYEQLVADYPPLSDISFATLHIWWNLEGKLSISILNSNLVINYHLPFDPENSGLSLIGRHEVETSIETIFEYLVSQDKPARIVHVPEFVTDSIRHRRHFKLVEELNYNEYILDTKALSGLEGALHRTTRWEINHFMRDVERRKVEIKPLNLSSNEAKEELYGAILAWEKKQPSKNDPEHTERQAIKKALTHAEILGIEHLGLYIDDKLYSVVLFHKSHDRKYYIVNHLKVDYSIPYIFDYMTHHLATKADRENIAYLNFEMDLGIENLRAHKMRLRPVEFFRKYTITFGTAEEQRVIKHQPRS